MKPLSKLHAEAIEKAATDQAKVKAAALAMIETPMGLIKAVLLKHEEAVIEVMQELHQQRQKDEDLMQLAMECLEKIHPDNMSPMAEEAWSQAIAALRERLK